MADVAPLEIRDYSLDTASFADTLLRLKDGGVADWLQTCYDGPHLQWHPGGFFWRDNTLFWHEFRNSVFEMQRVGPTPNPELDVAKSAVMLALHRLEEKPETPSSRYLYVLSHMAESLQLDDAVSVVKKLLGRFDKGGLNEQDRVCTSTARACIQNIPPAGSARPASPALQL